MTCICGVLLIALASTLICSVIGDSVTSSNLFTAVAAIWPVVRTKRAAFHVSNQ